MNNYSAFFFNIYGNQPAVRYGKQKTLNIFYAMHVMFSQTTHPVFFALSHFCNNVVFGALLKTSALPIS